MNAPAFDTPHRPSTKDVRYTLWTEKHDIETAELCPCASKIYRWMLERAPGGAKQDVDLDQFQEFTKSAKRPNGYSRQHILRAWKSLVESGLVIVTRTFGNLKRVVEAIARHAGEIKPLQLEQKYSNQNKKVQTETKMFQTERSNLILPYPITEDYREKAEQAAAIKNCLPEKEIDNAWVNLTEEEFKNPPKEVEVNTESTEICRAIREVMPLTPQLKAEALKYTLAQVENAIALYQERRQKKQISKPQGFLTDCLRGQWWLESGNNTTATLQYPPELVQWYALATEAGIVDGRPLQHCPGTSCRGGGAEHLQVVILIPPEELRPNDIVPFRYLYWRDAIALYPLLGNSSQTEEPAEVFELDNYEPNPEIQRLIRESLGEV